MKIRQLTKREQVIFYACVVLATGYGVIHLVLKPFQITKEEVEARIEAKQEILKKYNDSIQKAVLLEKAHQGLLKKFEQEGSNEQVMSQFISEIEHAAAEHSLNISDIKPRRVKKEEFLNRFSVSLSLESSLVDVLKFFYTLQQEPHYFEVEELLIEKGIQRQDDNVKVRLVLSKVRIDRP